MEISVIIVEYHCMDEVHQCVASVRKFMKGLEWECIIVSNSCYQSEDIKKYSTQFNDCQLVVSKTNSGYAGGVNQGIKASRGEYLYILNPDSKLTDSFSCEIIKCMDSNPECAIAGPKVIDDKGVVQPSCRRFPKIITYFFARSFLKNYKFSENERRRYFMKDFDHENTLKVDWVSGGAMIINRSALDKIGLMDERYFLYMEDVDWCRSCSNVGLSVFYIPISTVVHIGKHRSIKIGFKDILNKHIRLHLTSILKYFIKWRLRNQQ